jgi:hypothetical protein
MAAANLSTKKGPADVGRAFSSREMVEGTTTYRKTASKPALLVTP